MKKIYFLLFLITSFVGISQTDYGIKAGVSYNASGKITNVVGDFNTARESLDNATGYSIGAYANIDFLFVYIRPELQFTRYAKNFETVSFKESKIELPISVGYKVLPFLSVFAGPSIQYVMSQDSDEVTLENFNDRTSLGMQFGTRIKLGPLGIDLRYERGLKNNEVNFFQNNGIDFGGSLDTKPSQWVIGLSYSLN